MRTGDLLLSPSRGSTGDVATYLDRIPPKRRSEVDACVQETYRLAAQYGLDASVCIARQADETGGGSGQIYVSDIWNTRLNCGGLGVTDGGDEMMSFPNGTASARAFVAHMVTYASCDWGRGELTAADDPRYQATADAGWLASCRTLQDLQGKWFTNPRGAANSAARGNQVYPALPDQAADGGSGMYTTNVPGLPGGPLTTDYPIRQNLIAIDGYQRPGTKANQPRRSVQHGTGNASNESAWSESMYFVNGAGGRQASIHACADDREVVICVPLDEVTWQAADGSGPGNMNGYSCEMMEATAIWTNAGRRDNLIRITADFMGRVAARFGVTTPEQHWTFNWVCCCNAPCDVSCSSRHDCPNKLRHTRIDGRLAWDLYAERWDAARRDELGGGEQPTPPATEYPASRIAVVPESQGFTLELTEAAHRYVVTHGGRFKTAPSRDAPDGTPTPYARGDVLTLPYATVVADEEWLVSKAGSWLLAKNVTPQE